MNAYETFMKMQDDSSQQEVYLEASISFMDDDLREKLHMDGDAKDEADFLRLYCVAHEIKFNEEFVVN